MIAPSSVLDGVLVFTHVIPMYDSSDRLAGELLFEFSLDHISDMDGPLKSIQTLGSHTLMVDKESGLTIYSDIPDALGKPFLEIAPASGLFSEDDIARITNAIDSGKKLNFSSGKGNLRSRKYVDQLTNFDYTLITVLPQSEIYSSIDRFKKVMIPVSMLGILLICLLSAYFFLKFYKTEKENRETQSEMKIASELQNGLLPGPFKGTEDLDVDAVQRSARQIGGDLYDYKLTDGKLYFGVGDVSGKGIMACMYMAMASSNLHGAFKKTSDPALALGVLNNALCDRNETMMFCTMFAGVLDIASGEIVYCNAGHDRPLLLTQDGCRFLEMEKNIPLGIEEDYEFKAGRIRLEKGNSLFIYTDGVTEARSQDRSLFGESRLMDTLYTRPESAAAVNSTVLAALERFSTGAPQSDDITMLTLKLKKS